MNAFSDLIVTFGTRSAPDATRLGNEWSLAADGPGGIWTSKGRPTSVAANASAERAAWRLWAVGDVFAYRGSVTDPLARFAADLVTRSEQPTHLDMHAVVFGWNDDTSQLHVWVDRMGTMHAYAGGRRGHLRVGTPFSVVAEASDNELDWIGLTGFCGFGFYPADRTPYEDVRILRPATHTVFADTGTQVSQRRYWDWWYEPDHDRSDDEIVDEFHEVWNATLARQLSDRRTIVPVSGGLDSRTIVAGLTGATALVSTPAPSLFTYGYSVTSPEIRIAQQVARARGLTIQKYVVEPYLFDRLDDVIGSVEGFSALTLPRQVGVSAQIAPLGDRVVGGHWGDVWFDTAGAPSTANTAGDLVEPAFVKFAKRGCGWLLENVCRPNLDGQDPNEILREVLRSELERLPDVSDADMQLKLLKNEQWSFRWTLAGTRAYHLAQPTLLPFYANELVDLFLRVPSGQLAGRRLQKRYLCRHHPDLARVRWQDSGMSLFEHRWERPAELAKRAAAKTVRSARRQRVTQRNWEVQFLANDGPLLLRTSLHAQNPPVCSGLDERRVADLLNTFFLRPTAANGFAVDTLFTIFAATH